MDLHGKTVVEAKFAVATDFSEGLAAALMGDGPSGRWGYIDSAGNIVIGPQFASAGKFGFGEGLAAVQFGDIQTGKWDYIDKTEATVISARFGPHKLFGGLVKPEGEFSDGFRRAWIAWQRFRLGPWWGYIKK